MTKESGNAFLAALNRLELKRAETLRQQRPALEHVRPIEEVHTMSHCGHYSDSTPPVNGEHSENWQSIGALARKIVGGWK